jgi:hypothetical protein
MFRLDQKIMLFLTHIYNSKIRLTYFPALWKFSTVVMIPKSGKSADTVTSYRPFLDQFTKYHNHWKKNNMLKYIFIYGVR